MFSGRGHSACRGIWFRSSAIALRWAATVAAMAFSSCWPSAAQDARAIRSTLPIELITNNGQSGYRLSLASNGRYFAVPAMNAVDLWDVEKGRRIRKFVGLEYSADAIAFSRDGREIAAGGGGSGGGQIVIWDVESGRVNARIPVPVKNSFNSNPGFVNFKALAFSPDGRRLIYAGSFDSIVATLRYEVARILERASGLFKSVWVGAVSTNALDVSPDGRMFALGLYDGTISLIDSEGRQIRSLGGKGNTGIEGVWFSPDGQLLASNPVDRDKSLSTGVKIWNVSSGQLLLSLPVKENSWLNEISWSPDGKSIATRSLQALRIWNTRTGMLEKEKVISGSAGESAHYLPDGSAILTETPQGLGRIDVGTMQPTGFFGTTVMSHIVTGTAPADDAVLIQSNGEPCSIYAVGTKAISIRKYAEFKKDADSDICPSLVASADGKKFAGDTYNSRSDSSKLVYLDMSAGPDLRTLVRQDKSTSDVFLSADGKTIATRSDKLIIVVDAVSGAVTHRLESGKFGPSTYAMSPDGKEIVNSDSIPGQLYAWELLNGKPSARVQHFSDPSYKDHLPLGSIRFSPDSRYFIGTNSNLAHYSLDYWSTQGPKLVRRFGLPDRPPVFAGTAFTPGGDQVLVATSDGKMRLWNLASGALVKVYQGSASFNEVSFAANGERILTGGSDGVTIWNTASGELLASVVISNDGEWLEITPEGFFDASAKGAEMLNVVQGLESHSIDQFYDALHRPDLVREKLAGDPQGKVRAAAASLDLSKAIASGSAPRVAMVAPARSSTVTDDQVTAEALITDRGGGIGKVEWRINGVTLGVEARGLIGAEAAGSSTRTMTVRRALSLEPGENRIEVVAYNQQGLIASEPARVTVTLEGTRAKAPPRLYVMAVGVNDYWDSRLRLAFAAPDARALADAFRKAGGDLYERVEVTSLLDQQVTAANLDHAFTELGQKVRPQDVFVFFMAGHGKTVDGRFYFIPQDFRYTGDASFAASGVGQDLLQQWLARIPARKSVLLFDACESGALTQDQPARRGMEELTAIDRLTRAMGRTVLTATTDDQPAAEGVNGHGVFTYALLQGFGEAQADQDGLIAVTELASYVDRRVPEISYAAFKMRQVPQMKIVGSNFPIAHKVAVLPVGPDVPSAAVPTRPTHVIVVPATVREAAGAAAAAIDHLAPGTQVRLIETANGWVLIARDGKKLGYIEEKALLTLQ
jgi:WD40 repeat protein